MSIETLGRYFVAVEDPRCSGKVEHRLICQSALKGAPPSASKRDPLGGYGSALPAGPAP